MNTYTTEPDGTLVYESPIPIYTNNWKVDPENPCRVIPNVQPCPVRRIELRTLECGRKRGEWFCGLDESKITIKTCVECTKCPKSI